MAYAPSQQHIIDLALSTARRRGATPRETKALLQALAVESGFRNLNYGDRDSVGVLQQRPSQGWTHARDPGAAITDFLTKARQANTGQGSAGQLAQAVQRSAVPGRYDQADVGSLLQGGRGSAAPAARLGAPLPAPAARMTTVDDPAARKRVVLAQYLAKTRPDSPLLRLGVVSPTEATTRQVKVPGTPGASAASTAGARGSQGHALAGMLARAAQINQAKLPYQWGGGHGKRIDPSKPLVPLDCSGAVSAVLGVNPRVSGQFSNWGKPGRGSSVTVYSNNKHVLMEINGHFFGTSATNPGGGAGWIPRQAISPQYLKGFVARHPTGM